MEIDILKMTASPSSTIAKTMELINQNAKGIALIVNEKQELIGTITDGDIRRGFLAGLHMEDPAEKVMKKNPLVLPISIQKEYRKEFMRINKIRHLPLVGTHNRLMAMEWQSIYNDEDQHLTAMIMVGGEGQRLRPLTNNLPKPMIKVGGKPLLHNLIESLKNVGFNRILLNVRYLAQAIEDYFQDGENFGIKIYYIREPQPMGTAGGIGLIPDSLKPPVSFLVLNGDLLTTLNFRVFHDFHEAATYDFTLCGRPYEVRIPFGYPKMEGDLVREFLEKPTFSYLVNSGIYCLSPEVIDYVPKNKYLDMPDLIRKLLQEGKKVGTFPLREKYHEIGRLESLEKAEEFYRENFAGK